MEYSFFGSINTLDEFLINPIAFLASPMFRLVAFSEKNLRIFTDFTFHGIEILMNMGQIERSYSPKDPMRLFDYKRIRSLRWVITRRLTGLPNRLFETDSIPSL